MNDAGLYVTGSCLAVFTTERGAEGRMIDVWALKR
jgi:hypothetical protein